MEFIIEAVSTITWFFVGTVLIKGIVAHWLAKRVMEVGKAYFSKTERKSAIWNHYQQRSLGNGHQSKDILLCGQDKCASF